MISQLLAGFLVALFGLLGGGALWFRRKAARAEQRAAHAEGQAQAATAAAADQATLRHEAAQATATEQAALTKSSEEHAHDSALVVEHQSALKAAAARGDVSAELNARIRDGRL